MLLISLVPAIDKASAKIPYSSDWNYYKEITLSNSAANKILRIHVVKGVGTDDPSKNIIYMDNHCQQWPYDIAFATSYDPDAATLLPFNLIDYNDADAYFDIRLTGAYSKIYILVGNGNREIAIHTLSRPLDVYEAFTGDKFINTKDFDFVDVSMEASDISSLTVSITDDEIEGVVFDGSYYYISTRDSSGAGLYKVDVNGNIVDSARLSSYPLVHGGGFDIYNGRLIVSVAEQSSSPSTPSKILSVWKTNLTIEKTICEIDDHIGGVMIAPDLDRMYLCNWDTLKIYVYDLSGNYITTIDPSPQNKIQDAVYVDGLFFCSIQASGSSDHIIAVLKPTDSGNNLVKIGEIYTASGRTQNGLTWYAGNFYVAYGSNTCTIYKLEGAKISMAIPAGEKYVASKNTFSPPIILEVKEKMGGNGKHNVGFSQSFPCPDTEATQCIAWKPTSPSSAYYLKDGATYSSSSLEWNADSWTYLTLEWIDFSTAKLTKNFADSIADSLNYGSGPYYAGAQTWGSADSTLYIQYLAVMPYADPKPSVASTTMWQSIPGDPPTCSLNANPTSGEAPLTVTFSISASDPDGSITSWSLDVDNDGNAEYSGSGVPPATQEHTYNEAGTYVANLTVTDNDGYSSYDTVTIIVTQQNEPPAVTIVSPSEGDVVSGIVTIEGTASDADGTVELVEVKIDDGNWQQATGTSSWSYSWDTTLYSNGEHTIYARAFDGTDYSNIASVNVTVNNGNSPPTCSLNADPTSGEAPLTVTFSITASDPDGSIASWQLDVDNDGAAEYSSSGNPPSTLQHTYNDEGVYTAVLSVTDNEGVSATAEVTITVESSGPGPDIIDEDGINPEIALIIGLGLAFGGIAAIAFAGGRRRRR